MSKLHVLNSFLFGFQTSCTFDYLTRDDYFRSYILCLYICGFATPLLLIIFCYVQIYKAVARHEKEMGKMAKKLNAEMRQGQSARRTEIKTAKVSLTIVLAFLLSWTPYATVALIAQFGPVELVTPYVSEIPVMFAKASAMHNPLIYALSHPKFREAVDKRFPWLLCCCGVTEKEKEDAALSAQEKKSKMSRMDSVNSTAVAGTQSQLSEISNLDSDAVAEETEPAPRAGMRMKNIQENTKKGCEEMSGKSENSAIIKDIINAFAGAMTAQAAGQQQQVPVYVPPQMMAAAGQDPQLQQTIYAISQGMAHQGGNQLHPQARTNTTDTGYGQSSATTSVQSAASSGVVTTQADVDGSYTNKAYQTD